MWTFLAPFIGKILGLLAIVAVLLAIYLGIKRKGVIQERERWEKAHAEAKEKIKEKVLDAVSKDREIDNKVRNETERIKEATKLPVDSDDSKFRF